LFKTGAFTSKLINQKPIPPNTIVNTIFFMIIFCLSFAWSKAQASQLGKVYLSVHDKHKPLLQALQDAVVYFYWRRSTVTSYYPTQLLPNLRWLIQGHDLLPYRHL
jgi:hypothetical protein